jgi:hypothetical protein
MCDECGALASVAKQNILRGPRFNYTLCHPCRRRAQKGTKRIVTEAFREGVRRGHLKRDHSTYKLVKDHPRVSGPRNRNWNPDRELVAKREKARKAMYSMLRRCLQRAGLPKSEQTYESLGYSPDELYVHIEAQFLLGMSWSDRSAWDIDHIRPVAQFVAEGVTDPRVINALSNLRPLWKRDNRSRPKRLDETA